MADPYIAAFDFGTSYTVAAVRRSGRSPEVVEIGGERRVPSVVTVASDGTIFVGRIAEDMSISYPEGTLRALKNRLGDPVPAILGGRPYQLTALLAAFMRDVYDQVVTQMGGPPTELRLTHPATWNQPRINRLVESVAKAELPRPLLVPEPVAAALWYSSEAEVPDGMSIAVYDLGGGTFDTAVVTTQDGGFRVSGRPGGDSTIGGELFDEIVLNHIGEQLDPATWEAIQVADEVVWRQVRAAVQAEARRAKEAMSSHASVDVMLPLPSGLERRRVTRDAFEDLVRPYISETITTLQRCIDESGVPRESIIAVSLVGGASRSPIVANMVQAAFPGLEISRRGDPKATVALGATLADAAQAPGPTAWVGAKTQDTSPATVRQAIPPSLPADAGPTTSPVAAGPSTPPADADPPTAPSAPATVFAPPVVAAPTTPQSGPPRRRHRRALALIGAAVVVAVVAGAYVATRGDSPESQTTDSLAAESIVPESSGTPDTTESETPESSAPATEVPPRDFGGATVIVTGPGTEDIEAQAMRSALEAFGDLHGLDIIYDPTLAADLGQAVADGNAPNIAILGSPFELRAAVGQGFLHGVSDDVVEVAERDWAADYLQMASVDGVLYGVPVRSDLKSLVWYQPTRFAEAGYEVPSTFEDFEALIGQMAADGGPKPLCAGIESGPDTGWVATDWVEDIVLRESGPDVYDQWITHEIPFNDPRIVSAIDRTLTLLSDSNVYASTGDITTTSFGETQPLLDAQCFMIKQLSLLGNFFAEGTPFADGSAGAVDVFYLPDINGDGPVLAQPHFATAFSDDEATMAALAFMASTEYAELRQLSMTERASGGYSDTLSAARGQDASGYLPLTQHMVEVYDRSGVARPDASDAMPRAIGYTEFRAAMTAALRGEITAQQAADQVEQAWTATG